MRCKYHLIRIAPAAVTPLNQSLFLPFARQRPSFQPTAFPPPPLFLRRRCAFSPRHSRRAKSAGGLPPQPRYAITRYLSDASHAQRPLIPPERSQSAALRVLWDAPLPSVGHPIGIRPLERISHAPALISNDSLRLRSPQFAPISPRGRASGGGHSSPNSLERFWLMKYNAKGAWGSATSEPADAVWGRSSSCAGASLLGTCTASSRYSHDDPNGPCEPVQYLYGSLGEKISYGRHSRTPCMRSWMAWSGFTQHGRQPGAHNGQLGCSLHSGARNATSFGPKLSYNWHWMVSMHVSVCVMVIS